MFMMAKVIEAAGSQYFKVATRGQEYTIRVEQGTSPFNWPQKDMNIIIEIHNSKVATYICKAENAAYLIRIERQNQEEKDKISYRFIKFIDQDILFSWIAKQYYLNNKPFIWNNRTIVFKDENKTTIDFEVMEIETVKV